MENALVILCGGNSTRMGTDKALLPFGDTCLIEYLVRKFQPYFSRIYLSVKIKGDYSHLKLPVTEIPDIYPNQGPMSGIFSGLSMIDEECAFFMSVDTPFLEPKTGLTLLSELGDADICTLEGKASYLETATAAYSKNCITTIGKCLLLHQLTFNTLREKCSTRYVTEAAIAEAAPTPIDIQYYNLDTRDLFLHTTPVISFVAKPGTIMTPLIERLLPLLEREGLKVVHLIKEDSSVVFKNVFFEPTLENLSSSLSGADLVLTENFGADAPNKIEILRKYWSETPLSDEKDLIAVFADFPYHAETTLPVFDLNKPKNIVTFLREYLGRQ